LGFLATTNSGGAKNWKAEFSKYFVGRSVVIIPDNDIAGKDHANHVKKHLFGVVSEIKIVELEGLAEKGDISDWIALGHTPEELKDLVFNTPAIPIPLPTAKASQKSEEYPFNTEGLDVDKDGLFLSKIGSVYQAIASSGYLTYDLFFNQAMILTPDKGHRPIRNGDDSLLTIFLEKHGFKNPTLSIVNAVMVQILNEEEFQYDLAIEWANELKWDGIPRCEQLFSKYFGADETAYVTACSLYFTSAMAGRLMEGSVKADMIPILSGEQGMGKTSAIEALCPEIMNRFTYTEINLSDIGKPDSIRGMKGKLIGELAELSGMNKKDIEAVKAWATRRVDSYTEKFEKYSQDCPRRIVFIGTTNSTEFLKDTTGNRRWLPITIASPCLVDDLREDRDQIWAEAVQLFKTQGILWSEAQELGSTEHQQYIEINQAMVSEVKDYLVQHPRKEYRTLDIQIDKFPLEGENKARNGSLILREIASCLRYLGYELVKSHGTKVWRKK